MLYALTYTVIYVNYFSIKQEKPSFLVMDKKK